jgi:hypothetical protein
LTPAGSAEQRINEGENKMENKLYLASYKGKVLGSVNDCINDEEARIVEGMHEGPLGTEVTFQHPSSLKFEVACPENDDKFEPWMIEYVIYDSLVLESNRSENENKAVEAFRKYARVRADVSAEDKEAVFCETYDNFRKMFYGFYNGFMVAVTGTIKVF